ncbi:MAG TPA: hypothetical protein DCZ95_05440 [Verrucomicrobia bacterium]|nr:MAG: hypothetical protein A2X46_10265 [Lentisphaerae bacterium GWF2_57_35]HBA83522.1 hypothetical protein [Verrucomicrobiota bacterium]
MLAEKIERIEDLAVYQTFRKLADEVEKVSREYGLSYRWLRNQTLQASESACAHLTDSAYVEFTSGFLKALYRSRSEARGTMTHLASARDADLLKGGDSLIGRYENAVAELGRLIRHVEEAIELRSMSTRSLHLKKDEKHGATTAAVHHGQAWALPVQA